MKLLCILPQAWIVMNVLILPEKVSLGTLDSVWQIDLRDFQAREKGV